MTDKSRDDRWSEAVKKKARGRCAHCGSSLSSAHHIIPRGVLKTRWLLENGIYACEWLHRGLERKRGKEEQDKCLRIFVGLDRLKNLERIRDKELNPKMVGYREIA